MQRRKGVHLAEHYFLLRCRDISFDKSFCNQVSQAQLGFKYRILPSGTDFKSTSIPGDILNMQVFIYLVDCFKQVPVAYILEN